MGVLTMSKEKIGEAHLKSRLDYAQEILELLGEYDNKTVIVAVKKDVKRFERMLKEVKGNE